MTLTQEQIALMIKIIENLDIYVSDDVNYEMNEDMEDEGYPDFDTSVSELNQELRAKRKRK